MSSYMFLMCVLKFSYNRRVRVVPWAQVFGG
jgi:hypothetical protein